MPVRKTDADKNRSKKILGFAALLIVLIATVAALELTNTTHFFHKTAAVSGKIPVIATGKTATNPSKTTANTTNTPKPADAPPTPPTTSPPSVKSSGGAQTTNQSSSTLQAPFGSFVSNHSPNLSGSPAPSEEQSICNTTPGASCTMTFTNSDGVVKTLPAQTADSNGSAIWAWDVKTAGFTVGDWKIIATASLNGQSKSASDQLPLKVQP